jgi:hypothetical protein
VVLELQHFFDLTLVKKTYKLPQFSTMATLAESTATFPRAQKRGFETFIEHATTQASLGGCEGQSLERLFKRSCNMGGNAPSVVCHQQQQTIHPQAQKKTMKRLHNDVDGGAEHGEESAGKRKKVFHLPHEEKGCGKRRNRVFEPCSTVAKRMRFIGPITETCDEKTLGSPVPPGGEKHTKTSEGRSQDHYMSSSHHTNVFQKKRDDDDASAGCSLVSGDSDTHEEDSTSETQHNNQNPEKDYTKHTSYHHVPHTCGLQDVRFMDPWYAVSPLMTACC